MHKIACLCIFIAAASPLWSQVAAQRVGRWRCLDDSRMMTPAPVGGNAYPVGVGSEERSNYLAGGLVFTGAYVDNLMGVEQRRARLPMKHTHFFRRSVSIAEPPGRANH